MISSWYSDIYYLFPQNDNPRTIPDKTFYIYEIIGNSAQLEAIPQGHHDVTGNGVAGWCGKVTKYHTQGTLLLTLFNFNPSIDQ